MIQYITCYTGAGNFASQDLDISRSQGSSARPGDDVCYSNRMNMFVFVSIFRLISLITLIMIITTKE